MSDIVDSLYDKGIWPIPNLHYEAADEILRLRAENEKLRAALKQSNSTSVWAMADEIADEVADYCDEEMSAVDAGYVVAIGIAAAIRASVESDKKAAAALKETGDE